MIYMLIYQLELISDYNSIIYNPNYLAYNGKSPADFFSFFKYLYEEGLLSRFGIDFFLLHTSPHSIASSTAREKKNKQMSLRISRNS